MSTAMYASATPRVSHRVRLTRRGRRVLIALIVVPLIMAMVWAALTGNIAVATSDAPTTSLTYVTVNTDESLWDIAQTYAQN